MNEFLYFVNIRSIVDVPSVSTYLLDIWAFFQSLFFSFFFFFVFASWFERLSVRALLQM